MPAAGPATDRFDVQARAAGTMSREATLLMLRSMLEDRFQLRAALERRDGAIFALVTARSDRLGPQFRTAIAEASTERPSAT